MPRKRRHRHIKKQPSVVVGARMKNDDYEILATAAAIREVDLQEIVLAGAMKEGLRILRHSIRAIKRHKERQRKARAAARKAKRKGTG